MSAQENLNRLTVFGMAMSLFFLISYVICVIGYLILPEWTAIPHHTLEAVMCPACLCGREAAGHNALHGGEFIRLSSHSVELGTRAASGSTAAPWPPS